MITRVLLAALVVFSAMGILIAAPWPAWGLVSLAALPQLLPGLVPVRSRTIDACVTSLFLVVAGYTFEPFLLLLLLPALRALRRPEPALALLTVRDAVILAMATLAFRGNSASLAGAVGATILVALVLPRLQAERMAVIDERAMPAPSGAAWAVPAVAAAAALLFFFLPLLLPGSGADDGKEPSALGNRRPRGGDPAGGGPGGSAAVTAARRVVIGEIGRLQRDLRPIIEISVFRGGRPADAEDLGPLFRSGALEDFDGTAWESRGGRSVPLRGATAGFFTLPRRRLPKEEAVEQRLHFLAGGSDALFCLGMPTAVGGDGAKAGILLVPRGEIRTEQSYSDGAAYTIRSVAAPGEYAAVDDEDLSDARRVRLLAIPPDHDRASALARGELGASPGLTGRALLARLETFLARRCRYSLDIAPAGDSSPVEAFLFDSRRGHCELFASAGAVMLRSLGVPARVVVGFRGGLYDPAAHRYTLRGADAHAWTEAWFEETGWVTFDPTPSTDPQRPDAPEGADGGQEAGAAATGFFERILSFDGEARRKFVADVGTFLGDVVRDTFTAPDGTFRGAVLAVLGFAAALLGLSVLLRRRVAPSVPAAPSAPPPVPAPEAWALLLERLSTLGIRRGPAETGLELAGRAAAAGITPPESLDRLAAAYAAERFGDRRPSDSDRALLRALAEGVTREPRAAS